jgi:predicted RNA-binding Zn ribbon-like protein
LTGDVVAKPRVTGQSGDVAAVFVGGNLALDFVGTLNERTSSRVENLRSTPDLDDWIVRAGVLSSRPGALATDLSRAIALREAIYRVVAALVDEKPLPRKDLRSMNEAAAAAPPTVHVAASGHRRVQGDVAAALSAVARDGLELFDRADGAVLKWCADESCTHPFLDRSRGHRRRWCEMAACGDRAKAAAYRARRRAGASA